ncbi:ABC transporter ATP-binding protein [Streptantibioticus cattleyicolor]|uniref:Daunorubicin resistance ABC transporter ATPase subunit n=1 Tax=Streptantibioticus cattleyicolor (strain ATCC 35852 / DSM 46488 / JCM 4925 / NBRC 14057 / NRRL 8057) TaxID=1003195 RepID=F8JKW5_STREN|nr:ABC transporter ATP-binding protein [Streptantibioticus cattleyicolor]AEW99680.1 daunorubicin resistance ABC transporter ATPase subunit [Streptantibioticus cattleyicolor NRRL 8057 = DSM 46488]CCB71282.1 Putative drug resistance ABC transporter, ATPase subunit; putative daunorubicin resistance ABC transporter ATPase subunit [Streptantibioticus cattleyicolor NRRL 8057 = DSM 46488]
MDANAVDHLSFTIATGSVVGLLGPNGAGKSTLTKLVCGITTPDAGHVRIFGRGFHEADGAAKAQIGVVHQSATFDMMLPVLDNLRIAAAFKRLRWKAVERHVLAMLEEFGIEKPLTQLVFTLSGGEMRRLQLVRALMGGPRLLLLDEPSAGLDVSGRRRLWQHIERMRRDHAATVLWTSHYVEELERNCGRILILDHGRLVRSGTPRQLADDFGRPTALVRPAAASDLGGLAAALVEPGLTTTVDARSVHVAGTGVRERLPKLLDQARRAGIQVSSVEYRAASLEDAFMELVGDSA